jgi:restriction system protein
MDFELFVVRVLTELGFEVEHTGRTNDGGVDAEAVLSLEGLTSVLTKVQAKRWSHSVPGRVVRELRGALRVDERGLIVTTAEFTPEAVREATAEGKAKIGLLGGNALVRLCAERGIGVDRRQVTLLELSSGELAAQ